MSRPVANIDNKTLHDKAQMIRRDVVYQTDTCGSGHYGSAFSIAEILSVLYYKLMHVSPKNPNWADRDRFTMGKGHAAIAQFPVLADLDFFDRSWLDSYTHLGSPLGDHPDMRKVPGVDFSSGSIGHNLSVSVGMAAGLKQRGSPARVINLMGDGEQTEGQIWEAAITAPNWGLSNLVGIVDINTAGSDGYTADVMDTRPLKPKWEAFGWEVIELDDGHDLNKTSDALIHALNASGDKPRVVLAETVAGKGVSFMEGYWQWHLGFLGPADRDRAYAEIEQG